MRSPDNNAAADLYLRGPIHFAGTEIESILLVPDCARLLARRFILSTDPPNRYKTAISLADELIEIMRLFRPDRQTAIRIALTVKDILQDALDHENAERSSTHAEQTEDIGHDSSKPLVT